MGVLMGVVSPLFAEPSLERFDGAKEVEEVSRPPIRDRRGPRLDEDDREKEESANSDYSRT